jgi:enoyl-CoA hydratase/carnithine racemase
MGEYSKVDIDGRLMIVTINRPDVMNALHPMASQELSNAFDEFAANPELWVAIITGITRSCAPAPASAPCLRPRASAG